MRRGHIRDAGASADLPRYYADGKGENDCGLIRLRRTPKNRPLNQATGVRLSLSSSYYTPLPDEPAKPTPDRRHPAFAAASEKGFRSAIGILGLVMC
jgi:hypothetical protein